MQYHTVPVSVLTLPEDDIVRLRSGPLSNNSKYGSHNPQRHSTIRRRHHSPHPRRLDRRQVPLPPYPSFFLPITNAPTARFVTFPPRKKSTSPARASHPSSSSFSPACPLPHLPARLQTHPTYQPSTTISTTSSTPKPTSALSSSRLYSQPSRVFLPESQHTRHSSLVRRA